MIVLRLAEPVAFDGGTELRADVMMGGVKVAHVAILSGRWMLLRPALKLLADRAAAAGVTVEGWRP